MRILKGISVVKIILIIIPLIVTGVSAESIINDIVGETMHQSKQNQTIRIAWWIPDEFWIESFKANPAVSKQQVDQFIAVLHPFTLIIAVDGKVGTMGGITYSNQNDMRKSLLLKSSSGVKYTPVPDSLISPDLKNFLVMMKPVLSNMLGQMGENMNFYIFKGKGADDTPIVTAKSEGFFTVELQNEEFKWRLPVAALLPKRMCTKCNEVFPGSYNYCPYDGNKTKIGQ